MGCTNRELFPSAQAGDYAHRRHGGQPQRGCIIQPSVDDPSRIGEERLRWVWRENENNSEGVVASRWVMQPIQG